MYGMLIIVAGLILGYGYYEERKYSTIPNIFMVQHATAIASCVTIICGAVLLYFNVR